MKKHVEVDYTEEMVDYWKERSVSYSQQNRAQIEGFKREIWEGLILSNAPQKKKLRILDIGTGPGFFAIILAQKGHQVTAVDISADMLEQAKENARHYGADVQFQLLNAQNLPFSDNAFDLVISRDVTWTLQEPEEMLRSGIGSPSRAAGCCILTPTGIIICITRTFCVPMRRMCGFARSKADFPTPKPM